MRLNFKYIGWCHEDNSDKVWGVIYLESLPDRGISYSDYTFVKTVTFWGKRGGKLQTKIGEDNVELAKSIDKKKSKGYTQIQPDKLETVYPEFQQDLETTAIWAALRSG